MFFLISAYAAILWLVIRYMRQEAQPLIHLETQLNLLEESLLIGEWPDLKNPSSNSPITKQLLLAMRAGEPLLETLEAVRQVTEHVHKQQRSLRALLKTFLGRTGLSFCIGLAVRLALRFPETSLEKPLALYADLLAAAVFASTSLLCLRCLPSCWAWHKQASTEFVQWLQAYLGHQSDQLSCHAAIKTLRQRELRLGISFKTERLRLLNRYAQRKNFADETHLQHAQDLLPLAELIGLGVPLALILLKPLSSVF